MPFLTFTLNSCNLHYVSHFKYLGHVICDTLKDDKDIKREIKNLYARTKILINRFNKSSKNVKLTFRSFCLSMYDVPLWKHYSVTTINKFVSCYNKCIKKFMVIQG